MSGRLERVLDAAYACFVRHGVRKTTMEDIARAAGMSRPAVYQYVRGKEDAFRQVSGRILNEAMARARAAAAVEGTLTQRLDRVLAVRLDLMAGLVRDSEYADELISADLDRAFLSELADLLTATIISAAEEADLALGDDHAREVAEIALALTRGLERDLASDRSRERLRNGVALLVAGLAAAARPAAR